VKRASPRSQNHLNSPHIDDRLPFKRLISRKQKNDFGHYRDRHASLWIESSADLEREAGSNAAPVTSFRRRSVSYPGKDRVLEVLAKQFFQYFGPIARPTAGRIISRIGEDDGMRAFLLCPGDAFFDRSGRGTELKISSRVPNIVALMPTLLSSAPAALFR